MSIIEEINFTDVEEIKSDLEFHSIVLDAYKALFSVEDGVNLYFFKEVDADLSSFSEKDFYVNKIDRVIDSFKGMDKVFNAKKNLEKLLHNKDEILKILKQESISTTEIRLVRNYLKSMELDRTFYQESSRMTAFIDDSLKNLPQSKVYIEILKNYKVIDKKATLISSVKTEKSQYPIMGNNIYFSTSKKNIRITYKGHKPFPRMGSGSADIWQKDKGEWKRISSTTTWRS